MADATSLFSINNSQDWNVVAQTVCSRIAVQENYNSQTPPTVDLLAKCPASSASAINIPQGTGIIFTPVRGPGPRYFAPGEIVGTIRVLSTNGVTSCVVQQVESLSV